VTDGESEGGDYDEVNQEDSEQNEVDGIKKGVDSTGIDAYLKKQLVICNEEDTDC